jgi:hypothetical protein
MLPSTHERRQLRPVPPLQCKEALADIFRDRGLEPTRLGFLASQNPEKALVLQSARRKGFASSRATRACSISTGISTRIGWMLPGPRMPSSVGGNNGERFPCGKISACEAFVSRPQIE